MEIEAVGAVDLALYNETLLFSCSSGYQGNSVKYIGIESREFIPGGNSSLISSFPGKIHAYKILPSCSTC